MSREPLIQRYEHNYSGWVVTIKRRGKHNGERGKASFFVGFYGERDAFRLAIRARRAALQELNVAE